MGSLELIIGPMFAGKSSELINKIRILNILNKSYIVIKPKIDTREYSDIIISHNNEKIQCNILLNLKDIYNLANINNIETIFIDEGQFFNDLKEITLELVEKYNKKVIISGLDGDFNRKPIGHILELIPYADTYVKKVAMCLKCKDGIPGIFSYRITPNNEQICIGASDKYITVCRLHYLQLTSNAEV